MAAKVAVKKLNSTVERFWRDKAVGRNVEAEALYQSSLSTARKLGLPYQPATEVSELSVDLLVQRILKAKDRHTDEAHVSGALGGAELPQLKLSEPIVSCSMHLCSSKPTGSS